MAAVADTVTARAMRGHAGCGRRLGARNSAGIASESRLPAVLQGRKGRVTEQAL